jgi:hypothetical protein
MDATNNNNETPEYILTTATTEMTIDYRNHVALECLKAMLINPATAQMDFATTADFAVRQADAFILEINKPQV